MAAFIRGARAVLRGGRGLVSSHGRWALMAAAICWLAIWTCAVSLVAVGCGGVGGFLVRGVLYLCACSVSLSVLAVWISSSMSWAASARCSVDALMQLVVVVIDLRWCDSCSVVRGRWHSSVMMCLREWYCVSRRVNSAAVRL